MDSAEPDEILKRKYLARGPGDAATREYVVNKYLGGGGAGDSDETEKRKKKKKKVKSTIRKGNLGIVDEDDFGWKQIDPDQEDERQRAKREELERIEREAAANSKGVFRGKTEGWHTIQEGVPSETREDEMPAIVTETKEEEEEVLRVLGRQEVTEKQRNEGSTGEGPRMSSGQRAGLLTSDEIKREAARAREAERQIINTLEQDSGQYAETIYRDETGRKIDPKIKRAEEARARKEAMEREERRMEWGKGVVQRNEAEEQRRRLEEEKHKPLARYADDEEYNQGLREQQRWNDPAAGFLTNEPKRKGLTRPRYKGPWKPNRYMIPPGYRWDGVDRSNGFEDRFLLYQNQKKARAVEAHAWSTEDM